MSIIVYVCPTPGCGNYFGSSNSGDLSTQVVAQKGANYEPRDPSRWHARSACPDCRQRGKSVEREKVVVVLAPPFVEA